VNVDKLLFVDAATMAEETKELRVRKTGLIL